MSGIDWIQRLGKWRSVFAGWQLGTRSSSDPESQAVRDHREVSMMLRAEANAVGQLLIAKGIITPQEFTAQVQEECRLLCQMYEKKFPGFKATDAGIDINPAVARDTTAGWRP